MAKDGLTNQLQPDALLTDEQLTAMLQLGPGTLAQWRFRQEGPPYTRVGRLIRYRWRDVQVWLSQNQVTAGSERQSDGQ